MSGDPDPAGVMVITIWHEPDGLRARILTRPDARDRETQVEWAADAATIQKAVGAWLRRYESRWESSRAGRPAP